MSKSIGLVMDMTTARLTARLAAPAGSVGSEARPCYGQGADRVADSRTGAVGFRPVVILAVAGALIAGGVLCLWPVDRSALSWMLGRCRVKWSNFIGEPAAHTACCLTPRLSDVLRTSRPPVTEVIERPSPSGHRGHRALLPLRRSQRSLDAPPLRSQRSPDASPLRSQRSPNANPAQVTEVTGRPPPVTGHQAPLPLRSQRSPGAPPPQGVTEVTGRPPPVTGHQAPLPLRSQRSPGAPPPQGVTEVTGRPPPVTGHQAPLPLRSQRSLVISLSPPST